LLSGALLACLVVLAGSTRRGGLIGNVALAFAGGLSILTMPHNMEGQVLVALTAAHGVTEGDLAGFAGIGLAGWRYWRWR
jgi:hypothetical protein